MNSFQERVSLLFPWIVLAAFACVHCAPLLGPAEDKEIANHAAILARCQAEGRLADAGDHIAAYERCLKDAGVK